MNSNEVSARLAEMLAENSRQSEELKSDYARETGAKVAVIPANGAGRGPTGRLRNFRAMSTEKLERVFDQILDENDDPEALAAIQAEGDSR